MAICQTRQTFTLVPMLPATHVHLANIIFGSRNSVKLELAHSNLLGKHRTRKIIPALREAIQPDLIEWSETLGKILAIKQSLTTENIMELASLCQRTGLKVTIKPLPLATNETMVAKVVIYAFK